MLHPLIKKTAKKLYSGKYKGLFILLDIKQNSISFKNVNNVVFSYQVGREIENFFNLFEGCGIFSAGYVKEGTIYGRQIGGRFNAANVLLCSRCGSFSRIFNRCKVFLIFFLYGGVKNICIENQRFTNKITNKRIIFVPSLTIKIKTK